MSLPERAQSIQLVRSGQAGEGGKLALGWFRLKCGHSVYKATPPASRPKLQQGGDNENGKAAACGAECSRIPGRLERGVVEDRIVQQMRSDNYASSGRAPECRAQQYR